MLSPSEQIREGSQIIRGEVILNHKMSAISSGCGRRQSQAEASLNPGSPLARSVAFYVT